MGEADGAMQLISIMFCQLYISMNILLNIELVDVQVSN